MMMGTPACTEPGKDPIEGAYASGGAVRIDRSSAAAIGKLSTPPVSRMSPVGKRPAALCSPVPLICSGPLPT